MPVREITSRRTPSKEAWSIERRHSDQSSSDNVTPAHDFSLRGSTRRLDETINVELEAPKPWIEDDLLDLYYSFFHVAHPCALPCSFLKQRLDFNLPELRPVLLVMQYIGSLYSSSIPSPPLEALVIDALGENQITATQSNGYLVQALILYSVAVYWCDDIDRGLKLLDQAIFTAVDIGMNRQDFATEHGSGDPVLQECWRRTWWTIYVVDAHIAGSTHKYPFKAHNIVVSVDLPCEEQQYESGEIPGPRSLSEYNMREFLENDGRDFSSFAHLIGLIHSLDVVLANGHHFDSESTAVRAVNLDASVMGWRSLLPRNKERLVQSKDTLDEQLFRANMLINTYIVDVHRPLSNLAYCDVESVARLTHTTTVLQGIDDFNEQLTLSGSLKAHTPFVICMIANTTIAHLSACKHILRDQALKLAREKIRLNMGVLKALGDIWPLAERTYREVGVIAREILCLDVQQQLSKRRPRETFKLLSHHHPPNIPGKSLVTLLVTLPPGAATPPHTHAGAAVTALMIRGASLNQMNTEKPKVYHEGETWYEAPGCHHVRSENVCEDPNESASFYAMLIVDDKVIEENGYEGLVVLDAVDA
ncbi:MAG: hypothetical protein Q9190_004216 [Brigantiaea leucoxantha]